MKLQIAQKDSQIENLEKAAKKAGIELNDLKDKFGRLKTENQKQ